ncbi:MAG: hypothetical protein HQM08_12255 [Candidatus Riflebacteria bacterium]|nr:hypothetical protein [Candidatus Riflebacteria bacterium]
MFSKNSILGILIVCTVLVFPSFGFCDVIHQSFEHQLLVNQPSQSWEHVIDLPENYAQKGMFFIKRNFLLTLPGFLEVEREEFKPTYYYIKLRIAKVLPEYKKGKIDIDLEIGNQAPNTPAPNSPTNLSLSSATAARKPAFLWKGDSKYTAVSLYDFETGTTVFERVVDNNRRVSVYDEDFLPLHHFVWGLKQIDETGKCSTEVQARFKIENQNGTVVIVQE